jgi:glutamate-1-semialdehyde 2,1-aminomutase
MVRFGLNGSDATTAAVRVARAYTGRDHVAKCGYHGWSDWSIATHPLRSGGIPKAIKDLTHEFKFNDLESLEKIFKQYPDKIAAVVMEPMHASLPQKGFLEGVQKLAHKHGAVLVFDELITGFRLRMGGAAEYFGVQPDLACYGKAIASGEPLSVLAGRRKIMSVLDTKDIFFSFTYAGYLPAIAAARETLKFMKANKVHSVLWKRGEALNKTYNALAKKYDMPTSAGGLGPVQFWSFKNPDGTGQPAAQEPLHSRVRKVRHPHQRHRPHKLGT